MPCVSPSRPSSSPASDTCSELRLEPGTRPSRVLELAVDVSRDVESPDGRADREAEALERNRKLRRPALRGPSRAHHPDRIPVAVQFTVGDEPVHQRAGGIRGEVERAPAIPERIEQDLDTVVGVQRGVAGHHGPDHAVRLRVVRLDADVEVGLVEEHRHLGWLRGRLSSVRLTLDQPADLRRGAPRRLVEDAVDDDRYGDGRGDGAPHVVDLDRRWLNRRLSLIGLRDRGGQDEADQRPRERASRAWC